ncbi:MAG: hypothetical protein KME31_10110 [Tolypothrix carrinoi HA7290-LM1]|nr:hypothetical protein [Tolypothrix carrinoi HA7290-LM1]
MSKGQFSISWLRCLPSELPNTKSAIASLKLKNNIYFFGYITKDRN